MSTVTGARHARRRRTSKRTVVFLVLLTIAAGAVADRAETWWPPTGPFVHEGTAGEARVDADPVWVTVHGARTGTVLTDGLADYDTDGVWVAVDVTVEAMSEPVTVGEMVIRDASGREFRQVDRVQNPMIGHQYDPGLAERGDVIFEVPADAVGEVVVVVSPNSPGRTIPRAVAEIPVRTGDVDDAPLAVRVPELVVR